MLDPQVNAVHGMADEKAERIAAFGGSLSDAPGVLVVKRSGDGYSTARTGTLEPGAALDEITQHMRTGHSGELGQFRWLARAHLENAGGLLATCAARTKEGAARHASVHQAGARAGEA